jgi:hypothetical protein
MIRYDLGDEDHSLAGVKIFLFGHQIKILHLKFTRKMFSSPQTLVSQFHVGGSVCRHVNRFENQLRHTTTQAKTPKRTLEQNRTCNQEKLKKRRIASEVLQ